MEEMPTYLRRSLAQYECQDWSLSETLWLPGRGTHCVYRIGHEKKVFLKTPLFEIVYVGVSSNVRQRIRQHMCSGLFDGIAVSSYQVIVYSTRENADHWERYLIDLLQPDLNVAERLGA